MYRWDFDDPARQHFASLSSDPELPGSVRYSFDIDVGEFDLGHRLIARSITLWNDRLSFEHAFVPGITPEEWEDRSVFLNAHYDADVSLRIGVA